MGVNPVRIIWDVFYNMADSVTSMIGLNPWQLALALLGVIVAIIGVQLALVARGKQGWSLDDVRADAAIAERIRAELEA